MLTLQPMRRLGRRAGLTLIELMLALSVLTISVGAIVSGISVTNSLNRVEGERQVAMKAAIQAMESLSSTTFAEVFARFNATAEDDPGDGVSPGNNFTVTGLDVRDGDADGFCGQIHFPGDGLKLREDEIDAEMGLPRDLDGDLAVDAIDHSDDYQLLPVRVRVDWAGKAGNQRIELITLLSAR